MVPRGRDLGLVAADRTVFSNEAAEPLRAFKKSWVLAVLKGHGVERLKERNLEGW